MHTKNLNKSLLSPIEETKKKKKKKKQKKKKKNSELQVGTNAMVVIIGCIKLPPYLPRKSHKILNGYKR